MNPVLEDIYNSILNGSQESNEEKLRKNKEYISAICLSRRSINIDLLSKSKKCINGPDAAEAGLDATDNMAPDYSGDAGDLSHPENKHDELPVAQTAKSVKFRGRRTTVACDQFLKDDKALRLAREAVAAGETIVINKKVGGRKGYASSPFSLTPISPTTIQIQIEPNSVAGTKKLKPLPFSRVTDLVRARFCYDALVSMGPVLFVSINLSDDIIAKAYQQPNFLDWVGRRIKRELKKALARDVELYLLLEELCIDDLKRETIRPHLHGAMQMGANEIKLARKAIRKAVGGWAAGAGQFQVKFQAKHDFDAGTYAAKQSWRSRPRIREFLERVGAGRRYVPSFKGGVLTTTQAVRERAAEIYAQAVEDVLAARRGALLIEAPGMRRDALHACAEARR